MAEPVARAHGNKVKSFNMRCLPHLFTFVIRLLHQLQLWPLHCPVSLLIVHLPNGFTFLLPPPVKCERNDGRRKYFTFTHTPSPSPQIDHLSFILTQLTQSPVISCSIQSFLIEFCSIFSCRIFHFTGDQIQPKQPSFTEFKLDILLSDNHVHVICLLQPKPRAR